MFGHSGVSHNNIISSISYLPFQDDQHYFILFPGSETFVLDKSKTTLDQISLSTSRRFWARHKWICFHDFTVVAHYTVGVNFLTSFPWTPKNVSP